LRQLAYPGIAAGAVELARRLALVEPPELCVLAPALANYQYFHQADTFVGPTSIGRATSFQTGRSRTGVVSTIPL
jgi:hypothetical protein